MLDSDSTPTRKRDTISPFERGDMARRRSQRDGYTFKKSGSWYVTYRVDTPDTDDNGKQIRLRVTKQIGPCEGPGKLGIREAKRIAWDEFLSKVDQASLKPGSMRTLGDFVKERFQADWIDKLKPAGQAHYAFILRKHVIPALGSTRLRDIDVSTLQTLMNVKLKKLSVQTVKHIRNVISAILTHAKRHSAFVGELPTTLLILPELVPEKQRALRWDQVCAIANELEEPTRTLVPFLTLTGLRIGEAMGLRWKYLNLTDTYQIVGTDVIPPMCVAVRENFVMQNYQTLKTAGSNRNVPLIPGLVDRLKDHLKAAEWFAPDDPVFAASCGRPLDRHNLAARVLKVAAARVKLGWVSWHTFRHTQATLADVAGFSVAERQQVLGHTQAATTNRYTHADMNLLRPRLDKMVDMKLLN